MVTRGADYAETRDRIARDLRRADRERRRVHGAAIAAALVVAILVAAVTAVAFGLPGAKVAPASPVRAAAAAAPSISAEHTSTAAAHAGPASRSAAPKAQAKAVPKVAAKPKKTVAAHLSAQRFSIRIGSTGYEPSVVTARTGSPITLTVGKGVGCAAGFVMGSLRIEKDNSSGPVTIRLGPLKAGTYRFTCGMGMVEGRLIVR